MKLVKTASGKKTIKMSKKEWQSIGKTAGWMKKADIGVSAPGDKHYNCPSCKSVNTRKKDGSWKGDKGEGQCWNCGKDVPTG